MQDSSNSATLGSRTSKRPSELEDFLKFEAGFDNWCHENKIVLSPRQRNLALDILKISKKVGKSSLIKVLYDYDIEANKCQ